MHCYSPIDLSILPQPFYLGVSGKFRYIESPDETEACVLHVEASEHPTVKSSGDDQVPPVVVVHGTVSSQSAGNLEIKLDTYFNSREPKVSFKMDAELQERRYKGNFPNVLGQLVLVYGRLTEPRFVTFIILLTICFVSNLLDLLD